MRVRRRPRGFTLLELILALTALALIAGICYGAFHLAMRAVERGEVAVVTAQRLRVAADVLSRHMKSIIKYPAIDADEEPFLYCRGTATSWTFITSVGQHGGGGLTHVVYQVLEDPPRLAMSETGLFSSRTLGDESVDLSGEHTTTLLDGFTSLRFEYMLDDGTGQTEWYSEWDCREEEALPSVVRILVEGLPGTESDGAGGTVWGQEMPVMLAVFDPDNIDLDDDFDEVGLTDPSGEDGEDAEDAEDAGDEDAGDEADE